MKVLIVFGTRPEAIKLAPVIKAMNADHDMEPIVCVTGQHREMLDQVLDIFQIAPDVDLKLMKPDQSLAGLTAAISTSIDGVFSRYTPDAVIVQGDTTTAFVAGLVSFYHRIPVAHVEAGLRTFNRYAPFPEELNRKFISCFAEWHFVPTERARRSLIGEGYVDDTIHVVGNTVIDALLSVRKLARDRPLSQYPEIAAQLAGRRFVLITGHRRENFGEGFRNICEAIRELACTFEDVHWVYPVHLNPHVHNVVFKMLGNLGNVHLIEPLTYLDFVWMMDAATLILTDSGGVQEEAPSLGKPVLVMRDATERPEAVDAGVAELVGTDRELIVARSSALLEDPNEYRKMTRAQNPYGDGTSASKILEILKRRA